MKTMVTRYQAILGFCALTMPLGRPALAEIQRTATRSVTVQPTGPRQGEAGSRHFNVAGSRNDQYARFGVLALELPKDGDQGGDVKKLSLRLDQSVPRFAKDGKALSFFAEPLDSRADPPSELRFAAQSPNNVGKDAFRALHPLDSGSFTKAETGHADRFELE
jgi:hypothetical protein